MARHGIDVAAIAPPVVAVLDSVVEFEIVSVVRVADFLGPRPRGLEHEATAEALLDRSLQPAIEHVRAVVGVVDGAEQRIRPARIAERYRRRSGLIDIAAIGELRALGADVT